MSIVFCNFVRIFFGKNAIPDVIFSDIRVIFLRPIDFRKSCVIVDSQFEIMILKGKK